MSTVGGSTLGQLITNLNRWHRHTLPKSHQIQWICTHPNGLNYWIDGWFFFFIKQLNLWAWINGLEAWDWLHFLYPGPTEMDCSIPVSPMINGAPSGFHFPAHDKMMLLLPQAFGYRRYFNVFELFFPQIKWQLISTCLFFVWNTTGLVDNFMLLWR